MQVERELVVFNGEGGEYQAQISSIDKNTVWIHTTRFIPDNRCSPLNTELAIGISRGERMDWVLQKATELGVSRIVPLQSERTEVKLSKERLQKKLAHWQQIIVSACEQSQRNVLPELAQPQPYRDFCRGQTATQFKFILHHRSKQSLSELNKTLQQPPSSVVLLVGPEGGLSEEEIEFALASDFRALTLGPRVLRTETAPIVALSLLQQLWGDLN